MVSQTFLAWSDARMFPRKFTSVPLSVAFHATHPCTFDASTTAMAFAFEIASWMYVPTYGSTTGSVVHLFGNGPR